VYRLLIVTDNQNVKERLEAMQGWEALGFKPPRIRTGMEDAVECIHRHHIDAIAVEDSPAFEDFRAYLDEHFPNVPLFEIAPNETEQLLLLRELSGLLSRLKADDTNDLYDEAARMQEQRERWIKKVIGGLEISQGDMNRHIRLYRCTERLGVPCVLARLEMPEDDHFIGVRWHYGSDRLEVALRNFFGREHDRMVLHVAVVSPQEVRVLCYPACGENCVNEREALAYVQETIEQIAHYLGLDMRLVEVQSLCGLEAFINDCNAR